MSDFFTADQQAAIDRANRPMADAGIPMSQVLEDIKSDIDSGNIGVTADAGDVDSLALGGGTFTQDLGTSPANNSLNFSWKAGRFHNGMTLVSVGAGTLLLAASSTNYIEVDRSGTVSTNTSSFTSGRLPLWVVVTGSSSWLSTGVTSKKPLMCLIGPSGVIGAMLSTPGQTKEIHDQLGTSISGATSFLFTAPNVAAVLAMAQFVNSTAFATSDTDYWTWEITNLGAGGVGTTPMLAATPANTTKATGGSLLGANIPRALTLNATGANLITAANDVLQLTLTPTGSPAALTLAALRLDLTFQS